MQITVTDESGQTLTGKFVSREQVGGLTSERLLVVLERPNGGRFRTYVRADSFRQAMAKSQQRSLASH